MTEHIKCVVVGSGAVGKTCLSISFANNSFPDDYVPTVFDNYNATVCFKMKRGKGKHVSLGLWDTSGQDDYDRLRPLSFPETNVFLLVFSLVDPTSLEQIEEKWYPEIQEHAPGVPVILVGTKLDLRQDAQIVRELAERDEVPVDTKMGISISRRIGSHGYYEVSAKTQKGLNELFQRAIQVVLEPGSTKQDDTKTKKRTRSLKHRERSERLDYIVNEMGDVEINIGNKQIIRLWSSLLFSAPDLPGSIEKLRNVTNIGYIDTKLVLKILLLDENITEDDDEFLLEDMKDYYLLMKHLRMVRHIRFIFKIVKSHCGIDFQRYTELFRSFAETHESEYIRSWFDPLLNEKLGDGNIRKLNTSPLEEINAKFPVPKISTSEYEEFVQGNTVWYLKPDLPVNSNSPVKLKSECLSWSDLRRLYFRGVVDFSTQIGDIQTNEFTELGNLPKLLSSLYHNMPERIKDFPHQKFNEFRRSEHSLWTWVDVEEPDYHFEHSYSLYLFRKMEKHFNIYQHEEFSTRWKRVVAHLQAFQDSDDLMDEHPDFEGVELFQFLPGIIGEKRIIEEEVEEEDYEEEDERSLLRFYMYRKTPNFNLIVKCEEEEKESINNIGEFHQKVHKEILIYRSNFFYRMMHFQGQEFHDIQEKGEVAIHGISPDELKVFIQLIYQASPELWYIQELTKFLDTYRENNSVMEDKEEEDEEDPMTDFEDEMENYSEMLHILPRYENMSNKIVELLLKEYKSMYLPRRVKISFKIRILRTIIRVICFLEKFQEFEMITECTGSNIVEQLVDYFEEEDEMGAVKSLIGEIGWSFSDKVKNILEKFICGENFEKKEFLWAVEKSLMEKENRELKERIEVQKKVIVKQKLETDKLKKLVEMNNHTVDKNQKENIMGLGLSEVRTGSVYEKKTMSKEELKRRLNEEENEGEEDDEE